MKINYKLNAENYILNYTEFPLDENLPILDIENYEELIIGLSRVIDGQINNDVPSEIFYERKKNNNIAIFREFREKLLKKYDLLRINIESGDYNPETNLPYSPLTEEEKLWRIEMLNFTDTITHETIIEDYPNTPERILNFKI
jgi:hypothetical protein